MRRSSIRCILFLAIAAVAISVSACSKQQPKDETVAEVNGDAIKVTELREFLGMRGGVTSIPGVTLEQKRQYLDRLIAGRLLAQDARAQGLDNTDEFRNARDGSENTALITALLRKEIDSKAKVSKEEIQAEAKKIMAADNTLTDNVANVQAGRSVSRAKIRKVQEELIAAAKKEFPATIHQEIVDKIVGGETVPDNAVLATAAGDNVTYGDVRADLQQSIPGGHDGKSLARNPVAINRILTREATGRSLAAYAKKQGIEKSDWYKVTREDIERTILIDMLAAKITGDESPVDDAEVGAYYNEHPEMFVQNGKKVPLAMIKERLRGFLRSEKRKSAINDYIEALKKKATIKVNEKVLAGV